MCATVVGWRRSHTYTNVMVHSAQMSQLGDALMTLRWIHTQRGSIFFKRFNAFWYWLLTLLCHHALRNWTAEEAAHRRTWACTSVQHNAMHTDYKLQGLESKVSSHYYCRRLIKIATCAHLKKNIGFYFPVCYGISRRHSSHTHTHTHT